MKRRSVFVVLFGVLSLTTAPQAAAAECVYTAQELPVPEGTVSAGTSDSSPDNKLIVGWANGPLGSDLKNRGLVWQDGVLSKMADPPGATPYTYVSAGDINNSGTIAGTQGETASDFRAFRYANGSYEYLYTDQAEDSTAVGINEAGDIIGEVWLKENGDTRWIAMWPKDGPRRLYSTGRAVDISDDRKLVLTTDTDAWVIDGQNGRWTKIPGGKWPTFDNDRIMHHERVDDASAIKEWTLDGELVGTYAGGSVPYGKNSSGTVLGRTYESVASLWQGGSRTEIVAGEPLQHLYFADITDDGVLIGARKAASGWDRPALWICS